MVNAKDIKDNVNDWKSLLEYFGIDSLYLDGKHHPCPLCGDGTDRFRYDNKFGLGNYYCNSCGSNDGIHLIKEYNGWTFKQAVLNIAEHLGIKGHKLSKEEALKIKEKKDYERYLKAYQFYHLYIGMKDKSQLTKKDHRWFYRAKIVIDNYKGKRI